MDDFKCYRELFAFLQSKWTCSMVHGLSRLTFERIEFWTREGDSMMVYVGDDDVDFVVYLGLPAGADVRMELHKRMMFGPQKKPAAGLNSGGGA